MPDFLFELEYSDQMNARFEKTRAGRDVFYAFHGSRLENFHSIIHNGLHCHLNKVNAVNSLYCSDAGVAPTGASCHMQHSTYLLHDTDLFVSPIILSKVISISGLT